MNIVNEIKKLLTASRVFVEANKLAEHKAKGKQKKNRFAKDVIKIGQGGTLDPLADGVLGNYIVKPSPSCASEFQQPCSHRGWEGHEEAFSILRLREGC